VSPWYARPVKPLLRGLEAPQQAAQAFAAVAREHYPVSAPSSVQVPVMGAGGPLPAG